MARAQKVDPWWLAEEAICAFCAQSHPWTLEVHCSGCDRHGCAECVVVVEHGADESWCGECKER